MNEDEGGPAIDRDGAPKPGLEDRGGDHAAKGEKLAPRERDRGETSPADGPDAIDLDSVHDRAS